MKKIQIMLLALFAMGAVSAFAASSAFAAHEWLTLAGVKVTATTESLTDGLLLLHHKPPAILGGGSILIHCTGQFHGTVGPAGKDTITDVLGLSGELNAVHCEVLSSTNSICPAGELVTVTPKNLPWNTQLILSGSETLDEILSSGAGEPGYETTCKSIKVSCLQKETSKWTGNGTTGAEFEFKEAKTVSCTDGGTGTILGQGTVLDFFVS
jgi:hypothetical protein